MVFDITADDVGGLVGIPVVVLPGAATRIEVSEPSFPYEIQAGSTWADVRVTAYDAHDNVASAHQGNVILSHDGSGELTGPTSRTFQDGVATFSGLGYTLSETFTVQFGSSGVASVEGEVAVDPGPAYVWLWTTEPAPRVFIATVWPDFSLRLEDAFANAIDAEGAEVTIENLRADGNLTGQLSVTYTGGVASFSGLSHDTAEMVRFDIEAAGYPTLEDVAISVERAPAQLVWEVEPLIAEEINEPWAEFSIRVLDADGILVDTSDIEVALVAEDATGTLSNAVVTADAGIATFDNLTYDTHEVIHVAGAADGVGSTAEEVILIFEAIEPADSPEVILGGGVGPATPNRGVREIAVSANGRYLAILSDATNLVDGHGLGIYRYDRVEDEMVYALDWIEEYSDRVTIGHLDHLSISNDGRYLVYNSPYPQYFIDGSIADDLWRYDFDEDSLTLVNVNNDGLAGDDISQDTVMTPDGRFIAFSTKASNLISEDTNRKNDCILRDVRGGVTELISANVDGLPSDNHCYSTSISDDGRFAAFSSSATDLVAEEDNTTDDSDCFLLDRNDGSMIIASVDHLGRPINRSSGCLLSGNGRYLTWRGFDDGVFVRDLVEETTTVIGFSDTEVRAIGGDDPNVLLRTRDVSDYIPNNEYRQNTLVMWNGDSNDYTHVDAATHELVTTDRTDSIGMSGDGATVLYSATIDRSLQFIWEREDEALSLIQYAIPGSRPSVVGSRPQLGTGGSSILFDRTYYELDFSGENVSGRVFYHLEGGEQSVDLGGETILQPDDRTLLVSHGSSNRSLVFEWLDWFAVDSRLHTMTHRDQQALSGGYLSLDRRVLAVRASGRVIDSTRRVDTFVTDGGEDMTLVTSGTSGEGGSDDSSPQGLSGDGSRVLIWSRAPDLVEMDEPPAVGLYLWDGTTSTTTLLPSALGTRAHSANGRGGAVLSLDGRWVAGHSTQPADGFEESEDNDQDVFLYDTANDAVSLVSINAAGEAAGGLLVGISFDGRYVLYSTDAAHVDGDTNESLDCYVRDTVAEVTSRASMGPDGEEIGGPAISCTLSLDGRHVAFTTESPIEGFPHEGSKLILAPNPNYAGNRTEASE